MDDRLTRASKKLSWLLRHGAAEAGVAMDEAGWVQVSDALRVLELDRATLEQVVRDNAKQRFEVQGERIQASQGHSTEGEVSIEALEGSYPVDLSELYCEHLRRPDDRELLGRCRATGRRRRDWPAHHGADPARPRGAAQPGGRGRLNDRAGAAVSPKASPVLDANSGRDRAGWRLLWGSVAWFWLRPLPTGETR